ncbi:hypothetical protein [Flavisolibacter nicotianae]|uniref:hypothetical protein n=1 Tax=Flavisolibacter nicotianae TaxID=2364882 RepID=UPI0013C47A98|nr:hypothetical protein [Flavisolibacter nicotianae]
MKQVFEQTSRGQRSATQISASQEVENQLYNLLFAGKISLKEYLQQLKQERLHRAAA